MLPSQGSWRPRDPWTNTCELPGEVPQEPGVRGGGDSSVHLIWLGYGGRGERGRGLWTFQARYVHSPRPRSHAPSPSRICPASAARCAGMEKALRCSTVLCTKPGGGGTPRVETVLWGGSGETGDSGREEPRPRGGRNPDPPWSEEPRPPGRGSPDPPGEGGAQAPGREEPRPPRGSPDPRGGGAQTPRAGEPRPPGREAKGALRAALDAAPSSAHPDVPAAARPGSGSPEGRTRRRLLRIPSQAAGPPPGRGPGQAPRGPALPAVSRKRSAPTRPRRRPGSFKEAGRGVPGPERGGAGHAGSRRLSAA